MIISKNAGGLKKAQEGRILYNLRWKRPSLPSHMFSLTTPGSPAPTKEYKVVIMTPFTSHWNPQHWNSFITFFSYHAFFDLQFSDSFKKTLLLALNMRTTTTAPIFIHVVLQKHTLCFDVLLLPCFPLQQKTQRTFNSHKQSYRHHQYAVVDAKGLNLYCRLSHIEWPKQASVLLASVETRKCCLKINKSPKEPKFKTRPHLLLGKADCGAGMLHSGGYNPCFLPKLSLMQHVTLYSNDTFD